MRKWKIRKAPTRAQVEAGWQAYSDYVSHKSVIDGHELVRKVFEAMTTAGQGEAELIDAAQD